MQKDDEHFFDDCPICRAIKATEQTGKELTEQELKEAFQQAKEKGGIVGGKWFEERDLEK